MRVQWHRSPPVVSVIFGIYSIGFRAGTYRYAAGILRNGFLAVVPAAFPFNVYWDWRTLFDPLAVLLLWTRPRAGMGLAVLIMLTDILVNAYTYSAGYFGDPVPGLAPLSLLLQSVFATFIFPTAPVAAGKLQMIQRT